jgi:hypothetical protein
LVNNTIAAYLVRWFQLLCLDGNWTKARSKALRSSNLHASGRLIHRSRRRIVRILDHWPTADVILGGYRKLATIT